MAKFIDPPLGNGDSYSVDIKTGRIITVKDTIQSRILITTIPKKYIDDLIEDGYVKNWAEFKAQWNSKERWRKTTTPPKEEPKEEPKEDSKKEPPKEDDDITLIFDYWKKQKTDYRTDDASQKGYDDSSYRTSQTYTYERPKGKETRTMNYEGKHTQDHMDKETADRIYRNARQTSFTGKKHAAKRNPEAKEEVPKGKKFTWKQIVASCLIASTLVTTGVLGKMGVDSITTEYRTNHTTTNIATLLVPEGAKNKPSILARNTHDTKDFQHFWYDNENIAEELLLLPDSMFEAALYTVFDEMGEYRNTGYIDNFSRVIAAVARHFEISKDPNEALTTEEITKIKEAIEAHPTAYAKCGGCQDEEAFLLKNHYVTEEGVASEDAYVKHGKEVINADYSYIKEAAKQYDADWISHVEQPVAEAETEVPEQGIESGDEGWGR